MWSFSNGPKMVSFTFGRRQPSFSKVFTIFMAQSNIILLVACINHAGQGLNREEVGWHLVWALDTYDNDIGSK